MYLDSELGLGGQWGLGSQGSSVWDWNKLSPISGLSLPIKGFPKVQWGKAEWAAWNEGCGGQRYTLGSPWLTRHVLHRVASLPSPCPSLTSRWQC